MESSTTVDCHKTDAENAKKCVLFLTDLPLVVTSSWYSVVSRNRLGNEAFATKKFDEAITHYNEAIRLDPNNAVFYSNRRLYSFRAVFSSHRTQYKYFKSALISTYEQHKSLTNMPWNCTRSFAILKFPHLIGVLLIPIIPTAHATPRCRIGN